MFVTPRLVGRHGVNGVHCRRGLDDGHEAEMRRAVSRGRWIIISVKVRGFPREKVLERLASLSERQRVAYAAACAERLMPLYRWFQSIESWGDAEVLERGIELAWNWVKGERSGAAELAEAVHECDAVIPDVDDFHTPLASRALDAGSAVMQALQTCISPEPDIAAYAGESAWECAFGIEQSRLMEAGVVHIADEKVLAKAAQGDFVVLEEDLQFRSLEWLRRKSAGDENFDDFRREFGISA